jgi:hypothetical protein
MHGHPQSAVDARPTQNSTHDETPMLVGAAKRIATAQKKTHRGFGSPGGSRSLTDPEGTAAVLRSAGFPATQISFFGITPQSLSSTSHDRLHNSLDLTPPAGRNLTIPTNVQCQVAPLIRRIEEAVSFRKEVIQPQVPLRLPCYDLVPIAEFILGAWLLAVTSATSDAPHFRGLTGGVYKAQEHIHRGMLTRDY